MNISKKTNKGFTIIELIVVIAIIAVLSAIVLTNVNGYQAKARDARRKADFHNLQTALELYRADHGDYPNTFCASDDYGGVDRCWTNNATAGNLANYLKSYLSVLPQDPSFNNRYSVSCGGNWFAYFYRYIGVGQYCLGATLETVPQVCSNHCDTNTSGWENYNIYQGQ